MSASVLGLDTAKNVFQVHGVDKRGRVILRRRLRRGQLTDFFANLPICTIGLEATQGVHHWARVVATFGHTVRLVAPQFVKPYLQSQKNDRNDAAAICEAIYRPHTARHPTDWTKTATIFRMREFWFTRGRKRVCLAWHLRCV